MSSFALVAIKELFDTNKTVGKVSQRYSFPTGSATEYFYYSTFKKDPRLVLLHYVDRREAGIEIHSGKIKFIGSRSGRVPLAALRFGIAQRAGTKKFDEAFHLEVPSVDPGSGGIFKSVNLTLARKYPQLGYLIADVLMDVVSGMDVGLSEQQVRRLWGT